MADLLETSTFSAGVTRIETNEPVVGGEDGVANRGLKLLASRTRWLKDQFDALASSLSTLYALRTGDYSTLRARATTKEDVGLSLVANYAPTNDASGGSTTQVATAAAVKAAVQGVVVAPTNLGIGGSGDTRTVTSSTGAAATLPLASGAAAGLMRAADKSKLDGVAAGAQVNVGTNLGVTTGTTAIIITSSTGANVTIPTASTVTSGPMSSADKAKLNGIEDGANVWPGVYSGFSGANLSFPVGETILVAGDLKNRASTASVYIAPDDFSFRFTASGSPLTGVWRARGAAVVGANITSMTRVV